MTAAGQRPATLAGGRSSWAEVAAALFGATALWQDLDGLHVGGLPTSAPHTSIMWAWSADGTTLHRLRLDGAEVSRAVLTGAGGDGEQVVYAAVALTAWAREDGRVRQYRGPDASADGLGSAWVAVTVVDDGSGALSFHLPARLADTWLAT